MRRREFVASLGGVAAWPFAAWAQQPTMPAIGYLSPSKLDDEAANHLRAFRQGLKQGGGYVEGENVVIDYRWGEDRPDLLPVLAADLVRRRVRVIVVLSAPASLAAAEATTTIPTVFMVPEDPVRLGLVTSLSKPGGNRTGVNFFSVELAGKRLDLLLTLVPAAERLAVLINPAEPTIAAANLRAVEAASSYGTSQTDTHRQAGVYVARILNGAKPADLPVVQSTKFEFIINLQTAKTLGIEVPPTLLATADEVIE
jgi:putative tryptophan/tyrosine transport system substrate-binding protein